MIEIKQKREIFPLGSAFTNHFFLNALPWAYSEKSMGGWETENDVKISLHSSDKKLHRICQKVGELLLDRGHQSLTK